MRFPDLFFAAAGDEDGEDESFEEDDDSFSSVVGSVLALLLFLLDLGGLRGLFCFSASPRYFPRALRSESESSEVTDESDKNNLFASFLMFSSRRTRIGGGIINGRDGSYFSVANPTSGFRKHNSEFELLFVDLELDEVTELVELELFENVDGLGLKQFLGVEGLEDFCFLSPLLPVGSCTLSGDNLKTNHYFASI